MSKLKEVLKDTISYTGAVILKDTWFTELSTVNIDGQEYSLGIVGAYTPEECGNLALLYPEVLVEVLK